MTYAECEVVADAACQLAHLRDALARPADLGDGELRFVQLGIQKVIGLLGALPLEAEEVRRQCNLCGVWSEGRFVESHQSWCLRVTGDAA